jgi:hypothetical protein
MKTKTIILKATALLLIVAGVVACKKSDKEDNGTVPYAPCQCDDKPEVSPGFPSGEAYLFKDSVPGDMVSQTGNWIIFDSKTGTAYLIMSKGVFNNVCEICNYPAFAKEWSIPQNGCKVYFEGITYEPCVPKFGPGTISYFDYILTILKKN